MKFLLLAYLTLILPLTSPAALPTGYQKLSAQEKQDLLWQKKILPTEYQKLPEFSILGPFDLAKLILPSFLKRSFDRTSDELPEGRKKLLHPLGTVARVEFVPTKQNGFTGILKSGAKGLVRFSLAADPSFIQSYIPGMALKFFVDGQPSVNLHLLHDLAGQGDDRNFFRESFSNILPPLPLVLRFLAQPFSMVRNPPTELNVQHLTKVESSGKRLKTNKASALYQIVFVPNPDLSIDAQTSLDFRDELALIRPNTILYSIYARATKEDELVKVGLLYLRSRLVASEYGDSGLFFQHQK